MIDATYLLSSASHYSVVFFSSTTLLINVWQGDLNLKVSDTVVVDSTAFQARLFSFKFSYHYVLSVNVFSVNF